MAAAKRAVRRPEVPGRSRSDNQRVPQRPVIGAEPGEMGQPPSRRFPVKAVVGPEKPDQKDIDGDQKTAMEAITRIAVPMRPECWFMKSPDRQHARTVVSSRHAGVGHKAPAMAAHAAAGTHPRRGCMARTV